MRYILMVIFLSLPVTAHAAWSETGMNPVMPPQAHFEPQHHIEQVQPVRHEAPPVEPRQVAEHHDIATPGYFRRDADYYGHVQVIFPYADIDAGFVVPDGYETVMVNGETFYYNQGSFYQQVGNQLTPIPAVVGAVVDSIPVDYQIVMLDGTHYLFTQGVYYQRVDQGFEVVQAPVINQE